MLTYCIILLPYCFDEFSMYTRFTRLKYFKFDWFSTACLASTRPSCLSPSLLLFSLSVSCWPRFGFGVPPHFRCSPGNPPAMTCATRHIKYLWNSQLIKVITLISRQEYERRIDVDVSRAAVVPRPGAGSWWVRRSPWEMATPNFGVAQTWLDEFTS